MSVEAVLAPASFGWVVLQLHYDGRRPPVALLNDIAALGWSVPPPPARPASAIDWYTPDPLTGERFTVRPWGAVHDIEPPNRHLTRSTWNAEDRAETLRALAPVLVGHEVVVSSPVPDLVGLVSGVEPGMPHPEAGGVPAGQRPSILSFTAPADRLERIDRFLRSTGLDYRTATEVRTRRQAIGGSTTEVDVKVVVGEVTVRADQADALGARLRDEQALVQTWPAGIVEAEGLRTSWAAHAGEPPTPRAAMAVLRLELAPAATDLVERIREHPAFAGLAVTVSRGTRAEQISYRGSLSEVSRPCLQIEVTCPREHAGAVRATLAQEAGVPGGRIELLRAPDSAN